MKRIVTALLAGGVVFGAALGSAAALDVNGGVLQFGSDTDLTCTEGVSVNYAAESAGTIPFARISGLDTCVGQKVIVRWNGSNGLRGVADLTDSGSTHLNAASGTQTVNVADGPVRFNFPAGTSSASITSLEVTVHTGSTGS